MTQSPVQATAHDKIQRAVSSVRTPTGLLAVGMVLLFLAFVITLFLTSGTDRWILAGIVLAGLVVVILLVAAIAWRQTSPARSPYDQEYLKELLRQGYFYGTAESLIRLDRLEAPPGLPVERETGAGTHTKNGSHDREKRPVVPH